VQTTRRLVCHQCWLAAACVCVCVCVSVCMCSLTAAVAATAAAAAGSTLPTHTPCSLMPSVNDGCWSLLLASPAVRHWSTCPPPSISENSFLTLSPLCKLADRAVYFACVNFFLFTFFIDRSENNYHMIYWTDFRNIFTEWKRFGCR